MSYRALVSLMRLDKPVGIWLLLWPTWWALWLASGGMPHWSVWLVFTVGTVLMRSAGCVINDYADQGFDGHVSRTQQRPLVTGDVTPRQAQITFLGLVILAALLVLTQNRLTIVLACIGLIGACLYPLAKRVIKMPQCVLGLCFAWGIPMAFAAVNRSVPLVAMVLFMATFFWVLAYDTIYAMIDKPDDLKVGIYSTAVFFGDYDRWFVLFFQVIMLVLLYWVGILSLQHRWYYVALCAVGLFFVYQQRQIATRDPQACHAAFCRSHWVGFLLWLGILGS